MLYNPLTDTELIQLKAALNLIPDDQWVLPASAFNAIKSETTLDIDDLPLIATMPAREKRMLTEIERLRARVERLQMVNDVLMMSA